jgi:predicted flavoprotein YhiN
VKFDGAVVIGAGPAGLWAAESLGLAGVTVWIFDHKPSLGRKFLVAGRGGLNITHSEELDQFASRYDNPSRWADMLQRFPPHRLKTWFEELGVPTYVGTSGRVFPRSARAPEILERWLERLYELGCDIRLGYKFHQLSINGRSLEVVFQKGQEYSPVNASAVIFGLGELLGRKPVRMANGPSNSRIWGFASIRFRPPMLGGNMAGLRSS